MESFRLVALTLPYLTDPAVAIAATRAGGLGVLNLEGITDSQVARQAVNRLVSYTNGESVGIRLTDLRRTFIDQVLSDLAASVAFIILPADAPEVLHGHIAKLRAQQRSVWVEVTSVDQAMLAAQCNADGLVAKGHEVGGWGSEETSFILLQRLLRHVNLPILVQGGISTHTAAACFAAGAAGVVFDVQLALVRESPLPRAVQAAIATMDGSETTCVGTESGALFRMYDRPGANAAKRLRDIAHGLSSDPRTQDEVIGQWRREVAAMVGWGSLQDQVWPLGQDSAFAAPLAQRYKTVGGVLQAIREEVRTHIDAAQSTRLLDADAPLAQSHGTRYPIVQGPMTRVSDRAAFALHVAEAGGLPCLALALMHGPDVNALLQETHDLLGDRPWGVGILGFVPAELRQEQIEVIRQYRPPYAIIAGGRPDQALALEQDGISTYLHVPSPGLLRMFLQDGARRFVFEGRECGGHVGPRSSFVLWNTMIDVLLETLSPSQIADCHVLFAGGIHDDVSASMVAAMAAPLAERGARVGVLLGTAYLFTHEIVTSGAIQRGFQEEAVRCTRTVLMETGPGHAIRCAETPYVSFFEGEKRRLEGLGVSQDELRQSLEHLNMGRLRVASKGVTRNAEHNTDKAVPKFISLSAAEQRSEGMYMIGQVAALRDRVCSIAQLHSDVSVASTVHLLACGMEVPEASQDERPCDVAIVGMGCMLPGATDVHTYWQNILEKVDAIGEIPVDRWDWKRHFDPDRNARDKIYSRWGGFLNDIAFDPTRYGIPPNALRSIEPLQLLALEVTRDALEDAGYLDRPFPRERTSVIVGAGGGTGALGEQYVVRSTLPDLFEQVPPEILARLPEWTEDSFPGILLNVIAGRIANRFDLGGVNYTIDAACASSLAAIHLAVRELEVGTSDVVIAGGADNVQNPFGYLCFSKTQALSPRGHCRTFDDSADGIAISEGVVVVILKRLADAERDGDRIYAVIKGIAGSSDGRDRSLTAPRPEGQARALRRAYAKAGFSPATIGLIEAHGTGTAVGDHAEVETLKTVFAAARAKRQSCAIGSVKSMIGHTKCAAGVAGLAKAALALYHKVLPATLNVDKPNSRANFPESPFYINTETRPWVATPDCPRRAGVSAFGFGGTNFHAVLEEYTGDFLPRTAVSQRWPSELLLWAAQSRQELVAVIAALEHALDQGARPELHDLAYALYQQYNMQPSETTLRLALVVTSLDDLGQKLRFAREKIDTPGPLQLDDARGVYCTEKPLANDGQVAFLFPGQGSQYPNMLRDLAIAFPEVRRQFEEADQILQERLPQQLTSYLFPFPAFSDTEVQAQQSALTQTNVAQPALGAANIAVFELLATLGVHPSMVAGHSYGEYAALCAARTINKPTLLELSEMRGRAIIEAAEDELGTMAAVSAGPATIAPVLDEVKDVWAANLNTPQQTIISGTRAGVAEALERLQARGITTRPIAVACAFHSPLVAPAQQRLADALASVVFEQPRTTVFSNTTATPYPNEPKAIAAQLAEHLVLPVRFNDEVEAMYAAGARVFVEAGPRNILTGLAHQILGARPHAAIAIDLPARPGLSQLQHALGQLAAHGIPLQLERLFDGRINRPAPTLTHLMKPTATSLPSTTWLVNGGHARPLSESVAPAPQPVSVCSESSGEQPIASPLQAAGDTIPQEHVDALRSAIIPASEPSQHARFSGPPSNHLDCNSETEQVLVEFQELMAHFLETQRRVMQTYLHSTEALPATGPENSEAFDRSNGTLRGELQPSHSGGDRSALVEETTSPPDEVALLQRLALQINPQPLPHRPAQLAAAQAVLITDDTTGVAQAVAAQLRQAGHPVVILSSLAQVPNSTADSYAVNMRSSQHIEDVLSRIRRQHGSIAALIHLMPLQPLAHGSAGDLDEWRTRLELETIGLFLLAKAVCHDLEAAAQVGGAMLLAATCMGGAFGSDSPHAAFLPVQGGVTGLLKTLQQEWPTVRVRTIDVGSPSDPFVVARVVIDELFVHDEQAEVGYRDGQRIALKPVPRSLSGPTNRVLERDSVVLITGGARGITADIALELAERYQPHLVIVGRTPMPPSDESPDTTGLLTQHEIKAALIARMRAHGQTATPAHVEQAYRQLLNEREMRRTLTALTRAGARVQYSAVDVRDQHAFGELITQVYVTFGRIDGVIHGAGIIEDKLVQDKSVESFDRVVSTKVEGALTLCHSLQPETLRFLVFFSSVAGRYGNRGQADYAAANEILNKLALYLDQRWAARVVAINWGPWESHGMVSSEMQAEFARRGIGLVSPAAGRQMFIHEVQAGRKGEAEIVIAADAGPMGARWHGAQTTRPLLHGVTMTGGAANVEVLRTLDPTQDVFLRDHQIDGKPVLPFAMALELMAEVVQHRWPDLQIIEFQDMQLLKGVILDQGAKTVRVTARTQPLRAGSEQTTTVQAEITDAEGRLIYYRVLVTLDTLLPAPPPFQLPDANDMRTFDMSVGSLYRDWLFHGPLFEGITAVESIGKSGMAATIMPSTPAQLLGQNIAEQWFIDPLMIDSAFQLVIVWSRAQLGVTALPTRFTRLQRFQPLIDPKTRCYLHLQTWPNDLIIRCDITFIGQDGNLLARIEGMECPGSAHLNQLVNDRADELQPAAERA